MDFYCKAYTAKEEGYIYVYVSNENATLVEVYFDDVVVTHTKSNMVQYNEYYPFGLQTANSWTRENTTGNNFLGNGGTELNATSNLYDLEYRNYDPVLGRMNGVDPLATKYASVTPYNFSFNDPVSLNDPSGAEPPQAYGSRSPYHTFYTNDDRVDSYMRGEFYTGNGNALLFHTGGRAGSMSNYVSSWAPDFGGPVYVENQGGQGFWAWPSDIQRLGIEALSRIFNTFSLGVALLNGSANHATTTYTFKNQQLIGINQVGYMSQLRFVPRKPQRQSIVLASADGDFGKYFQDEALAKDMDPLLDVTQKFYDQLKKTERYFVMNRTIIERTYFMSSFQQKAHKLLLFANAVGYGRPFDIKVKGKGFHHSEIGIESKFEGVTYQWTDYGNINFGFAAKVLGLTLIEAKLGAGIAQVLWGNSPPDWTNSDGYFDEKRDTEMIELGYNYISNWRK